MKNIGIFIEPVGSLADAIRALKVEVERQLPGQTYCSHPPHCTLIVGNFQEMRLWQKQLAAALATISPFSVQTDQFTFFYDDALAGGGHTVALKAVAKPELFALQRCCADVLKHWRKPDAAQSRGALLEQEPFRSSFEEYGFPFVGQHWISHFTIASLKVGKESSLLRAISSVEARHEFQLDQVSVWEIEGDSHTKLCTLPLGGSNP